MLALDSNTLSYYLRGDPLVVPRMQALLPSEVGISVIVIYELRFGLLRLPGRGAQSRLRALEQLLQPMRVLPFDTACAERAAALRCDLERLGTPIGAHDVLIAATALRHGVPLVTRNQREFERVPGLQVINWHND